VVSRSMLCGGVRSAVIGSLAGAVVGIGVIVVVDDGNGNRLNLAYKI